MVKGRRALLRGIAIMMAAFAVTLPVVVAAARAKDDIVQEKSVHRIRVRAGHFIDTNTGKRFVPKGFNYFRVGAVDGGKTEHATFLPGFYDSAYTETMMQDAQQCWGFNTIRVFHCYHTGPGGLVLSEDASSLNPAYVANVVDFLRRARAHGIHVIFTWDTWNPQSKWLSETPLSSNDASFGFTQVWDDSLSVNGLHLHIGSVRTRANSITKMIQTIRQVDPDLLKVILAWELENESYFLADAPPLNGTSGSYKFAGQGYDLGSDRGKEELMDAIIRQWADVCARKVHEADPEALVGVSCFTFAAVGRHGPGCLSSDRTPDRRIPIRPLVLVGTGVDYIDIHLYISNNSRSPQQNLDADVASDEWNTLRAAVLRAGLPVLAGEVGLYRDQWVTADTGAFDVEQIGSLLHSHMDQLRAKGFAGVLYWSYGDPQSTMEDPNPPLRLYPKLANALGGN